jgi:hypothetical protein
MLFTKNHQKRVKKLLPERWDIDRTLRILLTDRLSDFLSVSLLQVLALPMLRQALILLPIRYATRYFGALSGTNLQPIWCAGQGGWYEQLTFGTNASKNIVASGRNVSNIPSCSYCITHKYIAQHNAVAYIARELCCKFMFTNCLLTERIMKQSTSIMV